MHEVCASLGVVLRPHGNGLVFEDVEQGVRVKASFVDRQLSKPRLCQRFGEFQPAHVHQLEAARTATPAVLPRPGHRAAELVEGVRAVSRPGPSRTRTLLERATAHTATAERRRLKGKYRHQRALIAALPISGADKKRLSQQLSLRQAVDSRALKHKLTRQRRAIQKTPHPGTWRHFVASRARDRDARAVPLLHRKTRSRDRSEQEREL